MKLPPLARDIALLIFLVCFFVFTLSLIVGCVGHVHSRKLVDGQTVSERSGLFTLFKKMDAELIQSQTIDGTYQRTIGATKVTTAGDAETVTATGSAVGEGAKAFVKPW